MVAPDIPTSWVARGGSHDEVVVATEGSDRDDRQLSKEQLSYVPRPPEQFLNEGDASTGAVDTSLRVSSVKEPT